MQVTPGLAHAVAQSGGTARWAERLGIPLAPRTPWTDERIYRELRGFLEEADQWPSRQEWDRRGRSTLLDAVYQHPLGAAGWAADVMVPHPTARKRRSASTSG